METKTCPDCKRLVKEWNEKCVDCGFTLVMEPEVQIRARYLRGPALGALLFTQGWSVGARTYLWFIASLIPIVGIGALIILTLFGRRISWERGGWASWEEFQTRMRVMDIVGVVWVLLLIATYFVVKK